MAKREKHITSDRDVEKMVRKMGLKRGSRQAVEQYGKGMLAGMRLAYAAVARSMLLSGSSESDVRLFLGQLMDEDQLEDVMDEAAGR